MAATVAGQPAQVGPSQTNSATTTTGAIRLRAADGVGRSRRRKIRSSRASSVEVARSPATLDTTLVGIERAREYFFHIVSFVAGSALEPGYPWRVERGGKGGESGGKVEGPSAMWAHSTPLRWRV